MPIKISAEESIEIQVRRLAAQHEVTSHMHQIGRLAALLTSLSVDDVELDDVERMIVTLTRRGLLAKKDAFQIQYLYMQEKERLTPKFCTIFTLT